MADVTRAPMNARLLEASFSLAASIHVVQLRKGSTVPYMAHLLGVTELVWTFGGSDVEAATALLHDAVEDGGAETVALEIERKCGPEVAGIVRACSDSSTDTTTGAKKDDWWLRKTYNIEHLGAPEVPKGALLVSACDKFHNLTATRRDYDEGDDQLWGRSKTDWAGQVWYYRKLLEAYEESGDSRVKRVASRIRIELDLLEGALGARSHDLADVVGPPNLCV